MIKTNRSGSSNGGNMKPDRYNGRYNNDSLDRDLDDDDSSMSDDGNDGDLNRESQDDCGINYRPLALKVKRSDPFKNQYKTATNMPSAGS